MGTLGIKPGAAGREAQTLPVCYATPLTLTLAWCQYKTMSAKISERMALTAALDGLLVRLKGLLVNLALASLIFNAAELCL